MYLLYYIFVLFQFTLQEHNIIIEDKDLRQSAAQIKIFVENHDETKEKQCLREEQ